MRWLDGHRFNGHELGQTLEDSEGQGSLACCSPWGCRELDMTWHLNNNTEICHLSLKTTQQDGCPEAVVTARGSKEQTGPLTQAAALSPGGTLRAGLGFPGSVGKQPRAVPAALRSMIVVA